MSHVVLHKSADGGVSITVPALGADINKVAKAVVPEGQDYQIVDKSVSDEMYEKYGDYRGAWEYDDSAKATGQGTSAAVYSEA